MRLPPTAVVSLGKLTSGHESYYEREVAGGAEDYYAMRGEAAGEWVGTGSAALGLEGQAAGGELRELLEGRDPASGQMLRGRTVRVTGWDVTYSPPKSVSVLHAAGDARVAAETLAAHRTAVRSALRYLESGACWTRRGARGAVRLVGEGFVGVEYVHRVSRAGDAQLHSHVVIGNLTRADGRWTTLDGRALYANLKTASALYHAELRAQMTRRLGVEWEPVARGKLAAEIRGVPAAVLRDQSRRHREIVERMEDRGESGPRAAQTAALDTRKAKDYTVDGRDVARELRARIAEKGLGPAEVAAVLDRRHLDRTSTNDLRRMSRRLLSAKGITEHRSTFSRGDVIQRCATWHRQGEPADLIVEHVDRWLGHPEIVALEPHAAAASPKGDQLPLPFPDRRGDLRYTTRELLDAEDALLRTVAGRRDEGVGVVPASKLNAALANSPMLTADQVALVRALTRSGHGIENVEAGAGAGKTFALRVTVDAFTAAGHPVLGTSTSNLACRTLEAEAGVRAVNTTRLLADLDRGSGLPPETVLLVDEAGMVGTRTYHRLAEHVTAAGGKLIGIGDSRQLAEIQAGGAFRAISDRFGAVALAGNRRQLDPEEIRALAALRDGDVHAYVLFEHQRGRLTVADDPAQAMRTQLADWWQATQREPDQDAVLAALRRSSVAELNANAHALMRSAGRLGEDEVVAAGGTFAAGDRVLLLRNTATLDVDNGDRGIVITADPHERALAVALDAGRQVRLPDWYLDAGWVDYGYALTAHKLQSTTVDRTFALATEGLYQEAGYSIATRARHETHFYLAAHPDLAHEPMHGPPQPPDDAIARFARHLGDSRAQSLATDEPARAHARALPTAALREEHEQLRQALNAFPDHQARALERLKADADRQREELAGIDTRIGQTAHQVDTLGFLSRHGREGDELRRETRRLESDRTYVQGLYRETVREIAARRSEDDPISWIDRHADQIRHLRALEAELAARDRHGERQRIAAVQIDPPDHITAVLGPLPESYLTRPAWERAVAAIETYRHRHHIAPDHHRSALGPPPRGVQANLDVATVERAVAQARSELHLDTHEPDRRSLADRLVDPPKREHDRSIGIEI